MKSILAKQEDGTIQLTITIPKTKVEKTKEEIMATMAQNTKLTGFRKGKAPKKLVEENIEAEKVREEVLKKLLPEGYIEAVKEHNIRPIMNPRIHIQKLDNDKDWEFMAITCEMPVVKLGKYKENVQKVTAKSKIILPGKEPTPPNFDDIVKAILESAEVSIPKVLLEQEVDKLLSQTLDEVKRLGLNLDQYLASTGRTAEQLRAEYQKRAENDIKLEFSLAKITDEENITVEEKEIDEAIDRAKDLKEKQNLQNNRYLLANILRQQKTLDFLKNL